MDQTNSIPFKHRLLLWLVAWVVTLFAMIIPQPAAVIGAGFLPAGLLLYLVPAGFWGNGTTYFLLALGWLFYVVLTAAGLRQKQTKKFYRCFTILCIALLLNVAGCHQMVSGMKN
ncbi:MAG: hypothetical protein JWR69_99 [Pedosphaera sp.]|nr:hypothetical protein [Pedosphaera sp.]